MCSITCKLDNINKSTNQSYKCKMDCENTDYANPTEENKTSKKRSNILLIISLIILIFLIILILIFKIIHRNSV